MHADTQTFPVYWGKSIITAPVFFSKFSHSIYIKLHINLRMLLIFGQRSNNPIIQWNITIIKAEVETPRCTKSAKYVMETILGNDDNTLQQCSRTERGCVEKNRLETSNGCWFWGPLVMVDMEPLSALNRGQTVKVMSLNIVIFKGNSFFFQPCVIVSISSYRIMFFRIIILPLHLLILWNIVVMVPILTNLEILY